MHDWAQSSHAATQRKAHRSGSRVGAREDLQRSAASRSLWYENSNGLPKSPSTRGARTASSVLRSAVRFDPLEFEVVVRDGEGESLHHVMRDVRTVDRRQAHAGGAVLRRRFRFLLDREPKESIVGRFGVTVISRYSPDFEQGLPRYLSQS